MQSNIIFNIYLFFKNTLRYLENCTICWQLTKDLIFVNVLYEQETVLRLRMIIISLTDLYIILFLILTIIAVIFMAKKELLHRKYHEPNRISPNNSTVGCGQKQKVGGQENVWIKQQLLLRTNSSDKFCIMFSVLEYVVLL